MTTPDQQRRINDLNAQTNMLPDAADVWEKYDRRAPDLTEAEADEVIEALEQVAYPLTEWLVERCGCREVRKVTVKIGRVTYQGAYYEQTLNHDVPSIDPGSVKTYTRVAMYLLGELPASYVRSSKTMYFFDKEECPQLRGIGYEWYVASWASKEIATSEEYGRYHYGRGPHLLLMPWSVPGWDAEEPYKRVEAKLLEHSR